MSENRAPFTLAADENIPVDISFVFEFTKPTPVIDCIKRLNYAVFLVLFTAAVAGLSNAGAAVVTAVGANDFLNSIGVCVHLGQGQNATSVGTAMSYAGIRNCRDMMNEVSNVNGFVSMHAAHGIKTVAGTCGPNDAQLTDMLNKAKTLANAGALLAMEGPNEPGNWAVTYEGGTSSQTTWVPVARFQADLYSQVKADATLKNYPVFDVSIVGAEADNCGLQFLTVPGGKGVIAEFVGTTYADYATSHNYTCGGNDGNLHSRVYGDNVAWNSASPTQSVYNGLSGDYGTTWLRHFAGYTNAELAQLPRVSTELGWPTGSGQNGLTEAQQGKLFINLYLAQFKQGISYTFIYEIIDDGEAPWGFFTSSYTAKLSGTYLHNFTTILSDTASFTPGSFNYSIASQTATVHDLLLQKRDGRFELCVWSEKANGTENVTVNFAAPIQSVKVYDPTVGTAASQTLTNASSVSLTLNNNCNILEISSPATSAARQKAQQGSLIKACRNGPTLMVQSVPGVNARVEIVNLSGIRLQSAALGLGGACAVDLAPVPAGSYVLRLVTSEGAVAGKIMVAH